jgi:uncharacterized membrane protein
MIDPVVTEWLSAMVRWLHVVAAIAWIGSSFYVIALDLGLRPAAGLPAGVHGEAWQVHGGGFYRMMKYLVAPAQMPDELTWFKWEAYTTWISGFGLLILVYYLHAGLFLVDPDVLPMSAWQAGLLSLATLAIAWLLYEGLCRSPLAKHQTLVALIGYVFLVAVTYGFTHLFSARGAFTQIGALIGTIMVANVFVVIIPNQKKIVADLIAGREPDPALGAAGKLRSVHNNYLTLPVVFLMISNHYPLFYATRWNWVIVAILLLIGPLIRHFFNERHAGRESPWWTWLMAALGMVVIGYLTDAGRPGHELGALPPPPHFAKVADIVSARCSMCHSDTPGMAGIAAPPAGIRLDSPARIHAAADLIDMVAVRSAAMPPGNVSRMTEDERRLLAAWYDAGASAE